MRTYWYTRPDWNETCGNVGDSITPYLLRYLYPDQTIEWTSAGGNRLLMCGSILEFLQKGDTVWGSGLISDMLVPWMPNVTFCGVRGPLTRKNLKQVGYDVPEVYFDPGVVLPHFYKAEKRYGPREYKLGLVPHYVEHDAYCDTCRHLLDNGAHMIDVVNNLEGFINEIVSCDAIVASSLHAIIIAEAYRVPAIYMRLTDSIIGGDFKFKDYYLGTDRDVSKQSLSGDKIKTMSIADVAYHALTGYVYKQSIPHILDTLPK